MREETPVRVSPQEWLNAVRQAAAEGFGYFDWLGCVDEIGHRDTFQIVLVLRNIDRPALGRERPGRRTLTTEVPRDEPRLDSVGSVFAGAGWHEREAAELFGVEFVGGESRRLLLAPSFSGSPLRKDEVLVARAAVAWPGGNEPGENDAPPASSAGARSPGRRRLVPPGVPDPAVWGDRDSDIPAASAAEVADAATGGRARRRRS